MVLTALPQTSWLDFGERKGREKERARRKERERKWSGRGVEERRRRQREGRGMEREEFCAVVIFPGVKR